MAPSVAWLLVLLPWLIAASVDRHGEAVLYDDDSRELWRNVQDDQLRRRLRAAVAAVVPADALWVGERTSRFKAMSVGRAEDLCSGERFSEQPQLARCTATLLDPQWVITAAHCVPSAPDCAGVGIVFDFVELSPGDFAITPESVYMCRGMLSLPGRDIVALQLERPIDAERSPFTPALPTDVPIGTPLVLAGHGLGVSMTVDEHAIVVGLKGAELSVAADAFGGNSGSPLLSREGEWVGTLLTGRVDFDTADGCHRARLVSDEVGEQALLTSTLIDELCDVGLPSKERCGVSPRCGDGTCSAREDVAVCPADCPSTCGDERCDAVEREGCESDCPPLTELGPPFEWACENRRYDDGVCDEGCGSDDRDCSADSGAMSHLGSALDAGASFATRQRDAGVILAPEQPMTRDSHSSGCALGIRQGRPSAPAWWPLGVLVGAGFLRRGRMGVALAGMALGCARTGGVPQPNSRIQSNRTIQSSKPLPSSENGTQQECSETHREQRSAAQELLAFGVVQLVVDDLGEQDGEQSAQRSGTGTLIGEGLVLTNAHVVDKAQALYVLDHQGSVFSVDAIVTDTDTDLALLRVSGLRNHRPLAWARRAPVIGEPVLVAGNAHGLGFMVSAGILSGTGQSLLGHARYEDFLLLDAAIVKGLSGGPVVNACGELIGVATATRVTGTGASIGLAISARLARPVAERLDREGDVGRSHVGLELRDLHPAQLPSGVRRVKGALVSAVESGTPAARAGLLPGDVVRQVGAWRTNDRGQVRAALSTLSAGTTTPIHIIRNGKMVELQLTFSRVGGLHTEQVD